MNELSQVKLGCQIYYKSVNLQLFSIKCILCPSSACKRSWSLTKKINGLELAHIDLTITICMQAVNAKQLTWSNFLRMRRPSRLFVYVYSQYTCPHIMSDSLATF